MPTLAMGLHDNGGPFIGVDVEVIDQESPTLTNEAASLQYRTEGKEWATILDMEEMSIAGYQAWRMTTRVDPRPHLWQPEAMIEEVVLWQAEDRFYRFSLWVPEDQRDGPYGQAFDPLSKAVPVVHA